MRDTLAKLKAKAVEIWDYKVAPWIGDYVLMPVINALGWVFDHPIPFTLTIIAGLLIGLIAGG